MKSRAKRIRRGEGSGVTGMNRERVGERVADRRIRSQQGSGHSVRTSLKNANHGFSHKLTYHALIQVRPLRERAERSSEQNIVASGLASTQVIGGGDAQAMACMIAPIATFDDLLDRHQQEIYRFSMQLTRNRAD